MHDRSVERKLRGELVAGGLAVAGTPDLCRRGAQAVGFVGPLVIDQDLTVNLVDDQLVGPRHGPLHPKGVRSVLFSWPPHQKPPGSVQNAGVTVDHFSELYPSTSGPTHDLRFRHG